MKFRFRNIKVAITPNNVVDLFVFFAKHKILLFILELAKNINQATSISNVETSRNKTVHAHR